MIETIRFQLNGTPVSVTADGDRVLLWVLRHELKLTGTKYGCGEGFCGACTVLIDGQPVRSCQQAVRDVRGKRVTTIEGLAAGEKLHPIQEAFVRHNAMQCGFCTSGMILTAHALLRTKPEPTREDIVRALDDHFCRCGGYTRIIEAVESASGEMKKGGRR